MPYPEEEFLQLAGLQHFAFCRRQWALIHLEAQWRENLRTVEGELLHRRAHDASLREKRGPLLILRSLPVFSRRLGLSGQCDGVRGLKCPGRRRGQAEAGRTPHGVRGLKYIGNGVDDI